MGYILMEESLFNRLMGKLQPNEDTTVKEFTEEDYWMSSREVCEYLHITKSLLNAYKFYKLLFHIQIKGIYHYKRAEVYKLKAQMDAEMLDSGQLLNCIRFIETEKEAKKTVEQKADETKAEKKPLRMRLALMPLLFNVISYTALPKYSDKGLQSAISIRKGCPSLGMKSIESTAPGLIMILKLSAEGTDVSPKASVEDFLTL